MQSQENRGVSGLSWQSGLSPIPLPPRHPVTPYSLAFEAFTSTCLEKARLSSLLNSSGRRMFCNNGTASAGPYTPQSQRGLHSLLKNSNERLCNNGTASAGPIMPAE
jgi:hypothetical protein